MAKKNNTSQVQVFYTMFQYLQIYLKAFELCGIGNLSCKIGNCRSKLRKRGSPFLRLVVLLI
jgi:hypothetical protein